MKLDATPRYSFAVNEVPAAGLSGPVPAVMSGRTVPGPNVFQNVSPLQ